MKKIIATIIIGFVSFGAFAQEKQNGNPTIQADRQKLKADRETMRSDQEKLHADKKQVREQRKEKREAHRKDHKDGQVMPVQK